MIIEVGNRTVLAKAFIDAVKKLASYFSRNYEGYFSGNIEDIFFRIEDDNINESGNLHLRSAFIPNKNDNDLVKLSWCVGPQLEVPVILFMPYEGHAVVNGYADHNKALGFCRNGARGGGAFFFVESIEDPDTIIKLSEIAVTTECYSLTDEEAEQMEMGWFDDTPFEIVYSFGNRPTLQDKPFEESFSGNSFTFSDRQSIFQHDNTFCILIASEDKTVDVYMWHPKKKDCLGDGFHIKGIRKTNLCLKDASDLCDFMISNNVWALFGKIRTWGNVELVGGFRQFESGLLMDYVFPEELAAYMGD